jgi:hypothetical protein
MIMARPERTASVFRFSVAAITWWNRIAVRASFRVTKERTDALIQLRADDVLETAGLRVGFGVVYGESIFEETFSQPVPAHDAPRALAAHGRKLRLARLQLDQMPFAHPAQSSRRRLIAENGKFASRSGCLQRLNIRRLSFFAANPDLLKQVIEANLVVG